MTYSAIIEEKEIKATQQRFAELLKSNAKVYEQCIVGYRGGTVKTDLFWHQELKFWYGSEKAWNRHWNIFGNRHPESVPSHQILCEINVPYEGRNNLVQGLFVRDRAQKDKIYVVHHGRLTITDHEDEGHKFLQWVRTKYGEDQIITDIYWDEGEHSKTEAIMVAALDDQKFLRRIKDFIVKAHNFKNVKRGVHIVTKGQPPRFRP